MPAVYGLPTPVKIPRMLQTYSGSGNGSGTITFAKTPTPGNILAAMFATQQVGSASISGGGVINWNLVGHVGNNGGSQIDVGLWIGEVGSSPSTTVSLSFTNAGVFYGLEISNLVGPVLSASYASIPANTGGGTVTLSRMAAIKSSLTLCMYGMRSGTPIIPAGFFASFDSTNAARGILYTKISLQPTALNPTFVGSTDNQSAVAIMLS